MPRRHAAQRFTTVLSAMAGLVLVAAPGAQALGVTDAVQPLGLVSSIVKPACDSPYAPYAPADLTTTVADYVQDGSLTHVKNGAALAFSGLGFDLLPTATVCDPTSSAVPGAFGGTVATRLPKSRLGRGWREIGATLSAPAPLVPGDQLTVPEASDAASVRVSVAPAAGDTAGTVVLTDLAPGPSTVTVTRGGSGAIATLTRADGSSVTATASLPISPARRATISGTARRWRITTQETPGTVVALSSYDGSSIWAGIAQADGTTTTEVRLPRPSRRRSQYMYAVALNRTTGTVDSFPCFIALTKARRPAEVDCGAPSFASFFRVATKVLGMQAAAVAPPAKAPDAAAAPQRAHASASGAKVPLQAQPVGRSAAMEKLDPSGLVPLAADLNGDGRTDFWTEQNDSALGAAHSAGHVFVSGPGGLVPHRVDLEAAFLVERYASLDSEISAIDDITGDGIGELIVDLGERQAMIPGNAAWSIGSATIVVPDPTFLDPTDYALVPSSSSPGAPYATLDDVTGDGRRELAATDDSGSWQSIGGSAVQPGRTIRLAAAARAVPAPAIVARTREAEDTAPRFDPRGRVIGGQMIALDWPKLARKDGQTGTVRLSVRDALGRDVRPPVTTEVPGNALLLDYDRRSGDALLLAISPTCASTNWRRRTSEDCTQTVVRTGPDGKIRQTLDLLFATGTSTAPQTARFLPDGPDADGEVDTVLTLDGRSLSVVDSTATGSVREEDFGGAAPKLLRDRAPRTGLRFFPVVKPDGSRRVYAMVAARKEYRRYWASGLPLELAWPAG